MFPTIPEDRSGLSVAELRGLVRELRTYGREQNALRTAEGRENAQRALDLSAVLSDEAQTIVADEQRSAALSEDGDPVEPEPEPEPVVEPEPAPEPVEVDVTVPQASATPVAVPAGLSTNAEPTAAPQVIDVIRARDGIGGRAPGETFDGWTDVAEALVARAGTINPATDQRHEVAYIDAQYPAERQLSTDPLHNMRLLQNLGFEGPELTAALCAPLTPYYGMSCENTLRRPVAASLPGFQAPRGGVSIMPSPSLSDVSQAGIWTHEDDDADLDEVENQKPCDVIECGTPEDFIMYAVYWCLRIKRWTALTFPELIEAYLNRGLASRARVAERQLLDGMGAGVPTIDTPELGYGSAVRITTQLLNYFSLYREQQRWDNEPFNGWAHRYLLDALRIDQSRRRRDGSWQIASEAEVNARFADVGINMTWTLDAATWMTSVPALTTAQSPSTSALGSLSPLPSEAEILVAPVGKFAMIDRAQVGVGVTGNNLYADNTSLARNEFTFFVESYEGIVDTTSCPAHILHFEDLCHNGQQIADIEMDCDGSAAA